MKTAGFPWTGEWREIPTHFNFYGAEATDGGPGHYVVKFRASCTSIVARGLRVPERRLLRVLRVPRWSLHDNVGFAVDLRYVHDWKTYTAREFARPRLFRHTGWLTEGAKVPGDHRTVAGGIHRYDLGDLMREHAVRIFGPLPTYKPDVVGELIRKHKRKH